MPTLESALPRSELLPYVRAYAQRRVEATALSLVEAVPPQLEQVLNFELGVMPGIRHRCCEINEAVWVGGAQTTFPGYMDLKGGVESFAVFFQPLGWSQLFRIPMIHMTNHIYDATAVMGSRLRSLWNQLGEAETFRKRVTIVENHLLRFLSGRMALSPIEATATHIFRIQGQVRVPQLAEAYSYGQRQFERLFLQHVGATPKTFARVARFQAAVDAKLANPERTWIDIAHVFGYHDQMHMIHDFKSLGGSAPQELIDQMGDVRPPALSSAA